MNSLRWRITYEWIDWWNKYIEKQIHHLKGPKFNETQIQKAIYKFRLGKLGENMAHYTRFFMETLKSSAFRITTFEGKHLHNVLFFKPPLGIPSYKKIPVRGKLGALSVEYLPARELELIVHGPTWVSNTVHQENLRDNVHQTQINRFFPFLSLIEFTFQIEKSPTYLMRSNQSTHHQSN